MAETLLVSAASWNGTYRSFNGDGTATFWANSFLPFWGRLCAIAAYLRADETMPIGGVTLHGTAAGNGAALIGMPPTAVLGWAGGTLFDFLNSFGDYFVAFANAVVMKAGSTVVGPLVFSGSNARVIYREPITLPDAATHTLTLAYDFATVPDVGQLSIYTLPNPTIAGQWLLTRRRVFAGGNTARFVRTDNTILASYTGTGDGAVLFVSQADGSGGFEWSSWFYTGAVSIGGS